MGDSVRSDGTASRQRVSVIMPVWQPHPEWFPAAVAAAAGQEGCDVELIIVDDGNELPLAIGFPDVMTDATSLKTIRHSGVAAARNAGVSVATGQWIRFIDADDIIPSWSTAHLLALSGGAHGLTIAYGATAFCGSDLRPYRVASSRVKGNALRWCALGRFEVMLPALLFPRPVVSAAGPWDVEMDLLEDWDFVLRCLEHAPVIGSQQIVSYYRRHEDSLTGGARSPEVAAASRRTLEKFCSRNASLPRRVREAVLASARLDELGVGGHQWTAAAMWRLAARHPVVAMHGVRADLQRMVRRRIRPLVRAR